MGYSLFSQLTIDGVWAGKVIHETAKTFGRVTDPYTLIPNMLQFLLSSLRYENTNDLTLILKQIEYESIKSGFDLYIETLPWLFSIEGRNQ